MGINVTEKNRDVFNVNPRRGSGGVAILVKDDILEHFKIDILNDEVQDILWIKLSNNEDSYCICSCCLPPENSTYNDSLHFYTKLGVDNVQIREVIDDISYRNGDLLVEFLIDCNICMINGRISNN